MTGAAHEVAVLLVETLGELGLDRLLARPLADEILVGAFLLVQDLPAAIDKRVEQRGLEATVLGLDVIDHAFKGDVGVVSGEQGTLLTVESLAFNLARGGPSVNP